MNLKIICLLVALSAINADKILEIAPFGDQFVQTTGVHSVSTEDHYEGYNLTYSIANQPSVLINGAVTWGTEGILGLNMVLAKVAKVSDLTGFTATTSHLMSFVVRDTAADTFSFYVVGTNDISKAPIVTDLSTELVLYVSPTNTNQACHDMAYGLNNIIYIYCQSYTDAASPVDQVLIIDISTIATPTLTTMAGSALAATAVVAGQKHHMLTYTNSTTSFLFKWIEWVGGEPLPNFVEIWNLNDPATPSYDGLLTKDQMGVDSFNVVKVAADDGKLFISTFDSNLYKIIELNPTTPTYKWLIYSTLGKILDFSVQHTDILPVNPIASLGTTLVGMVADNGMIYFLDWYNDFTPYIVSEYQLGGLYNAVTPGYEPITGALNLDWSTNFIHFWGVSASGMIQELVVRIGDYVGSNKHCTLTWTMPLNCYFDRTTDRIFQTTTAFSLMPYQFTFPSITFQTSIHVTGTESFTLTVQSVAATKNVVFSITFYDVTVTSVSTLSSAAAQPTTFNSNYPDSRTIDLSKYKTGPGLMYDATFADGVVNMRTFLQNKLTFSPESISHTAFEFMDIKEIIGSRLSGYQVFVQTAYDGVANSLLLLDCIDSQDFEDGIDATITCKLNNINLLSGPVTEIIKLDDSYGIYIAGNPTVNFYSYTSSATITASINLGASVPDTFLDAVSYLMISFPADGKIDLYDILLNEDLTAAPISITATTLGLTEGTFTPTNMHYFLLQGSLMHITNGGSVIVGIVDHLGLTASDTLKVVSTITSTATGDANGFQLVGATLIKVYIAAGTGTSIEEWDINQPGTPIMSGSFPTYDLTLDVKSANTYSHSYNIGSEIFYIQGSRIVNSVQEYYVLSYRGGERTSSKLLYTQAIGTTPVQFIQSQGSGLSYRSSFVFVVIGGNMTVWEAFDEPGCVVTPSFGMQDTEQNKIAPLSLTVTNMWYTATDQTLAFSVDYANVKGIVTLNPNAQLEIATYNISITNETVFLQYAFKLENIFNGVFLNTTMTCPVVSDCTSDVIKWEDRVNLQNNFDELEIVEDVVSNGQQFFLQTQTKIKVYSAEYPNNALSQTVDLPGGFQCDRIALTDDGTHSVSVCDNTEKNTGEMVVISYLTTPPSVVQTFSHDIDAADQVMFKGQFLIIKDVRLDGFKIFCYKFDVANFGYITGPVGTAQSYNWGFNALSAGQYGAVMDAGSTTVKVIFLSFDNQVESSRLFTVDFTEAGTSTYTAYKWDSTNGAPQMTNTKAIWGGLVANNGAAGTVDLTVLLVDFESAYYLSDITYNWASQSVTNQGMRYAPIGNFIAKRKLQVYGYPVQQVALALLPAEGSSESLSKYIIYDTRKAVPGDGVTYSTTYALGEGPQYTEEYEQILSNSLKRNHLTFALNSDSLVIGTWFLSEKSFQVWNATLSGWLLIKDNTLQSKNITLMAENQPFSASVVVELTNTHPVDPPGPGPDPVNPDDSGSETNWLMVGGIGAIVVVAVIVIIIVVKSFASQGNHEDNTEDRGYLRQSELSQTNI